MRPERRISATPRPTLVTFTAGLLRFAGVAIVLCALSCYLLFHFFGGPLCRNEIFQEVDSPDSRYRVVVFQRDCGATTGFTTQISILGSDTRLRNHPGNLLRIDGHPDWTEVEVRWEEDRRVTITYRESRRIYKQETRFRHWFTVINVRYKVLPSE